MVDVKSVLDSAERFIMLAQGDCNFPGASVQHGILFDTISDMDLHK